MNKNSNLIQLLQERVQRRPLQLAYTFLTDGETDEVSLTYEEIDRRARAIAAWLQALRAEGERVLLLYPPGVEYISAFWGCLYAGAVAVPAYPPRQNRSLLRLQAVAADAQASLALTTSSLLAKVDAMTAECVELKSLRWLATDTIPDGLAAEWRTPSLTGESLAFLQYTSGSSSTPKGVMVTHGNLLHNERMIQEAFKQTEQSVIVGWLPLYHDMGLIGNVLQPVYVGARCVLMSPVAFLQDPFRWLSAVSRYRATTSGGPNFAYDLCVRKIDAGRRELLDLSSWEVAFNGAEPVRAETLDAFAETFAPYGFRRQAFRPCYGLAEATLLVTGEGLPQHTPLVKSVAAESLQGNLLTEAREGGESTRALVGCGRVASGQKVYIYHPETMAECAPGQIGEICVSGANVAQGYWNRPDETARVFQSHVRDGRGEPLLRTGDLGCFLDGDLFVTGRIKDLIIIRGRNHYPQDIERTVEQSHPALRPGSGAAFVVEADGEERLVVAQEVSGRRRLQSEEIVRAITDAVAAEHEVQVHAVVLLKTGGIPKTSSGKIQRHACREKFLSKGFDALAQWEGGPAPRSADEAPAAKPDLRSAGAIEAWLRSEVAAKLGVHTSAVATDRPVTDYALDSLAAIELTHRIEAVLGVSLSMTSFLAGPTIAELARQTQAAHAAGVEVPTAPPVRAASSSGFALSHGQRALWFLHQLAPDSAAYNVATVVRVLSGLDAAALRRAFQSLLDRHACLRTTFGMHGDEPRQHVFDYMEVCLQEVDASAWSEAEFNSRLVEESNRRFDLEQGPLMRVSLFTRSAEEHVILFVIHHIVTDFWSLVTLTNELGALYQAEVSGAPAQLPTNLFDYADFVRRQEEMLAGPRGEQLWAYWQQQLGGELPVLDLPVDRPRPAQQTYRGGSETFKLDEEVTRGLKNLSREQGATLYMTLLAAFQTLLYRYTGQEDILVGSPTSGRNQSGLAGATGYFVNPVVLRAGLSGRRSFASFLRQTKQTVLAAFEHQDYPFPLLVERLQPEREASRSPLFQAMFILQKAPLSDERGIALFALGEAGARVKLGALELESAALEQRISQFDLTLVMAEAGETLSASLQYNTDLFEAATIRRMCEHLKTLLRGIVAWPEQQLSGLPLLTDAEQHQILYDWNETGESGLPGVRLHHLFEAQAARTPAAAAVVCGDHTLTYAELDARASALGRRLRACGARPDAYVGLLLRRRAELVVALLAVLKSGAAYLPLDASYPRERLRFMLEDAQAPLLLTERGLYDLATELCTGDTGLGAAPPRLVCLEDEGEETAGTVAGLAEETSATARDAAYVIYTSGSTGRPKGVVIEHASAVARVRWAGEHFGADRLRGVLFSTSVCFDLSVFEVFAPLAVGGTVIVAADALELPRLASCAPVTLVNTVPSAMAELVRGGVLPVGVRTVNLAGEALPRELAEAVYGAGAEEVVNLYGPSEDTTYSTCAAVERDGMGAPAIGRPLPGTRLYVLDGCGQPVPEGVTGELYIGGAGLGRGYLNRPALTAERFIPDPYSGEAGARLYRTGDLVRYAAGGVVEYLGRVDHQVKLRGYRIELGEVEACLRAHPAVRECVAAVEGEGAERRLVCYVVVEGGVGAVELREWARARVPEYMVASAFVELEALPLTANGKVDRKALAAAWGAGSVGLAACGREPSAGLEAEVAEVWCAALGRAAVGAEEDFFAAGGHSLLATRVVSGVRKRFGVEVGLREFFEAATVEGLARLIHLARLSSQSVSTAPSIKPITRGGKLPLSFAQQRLWFLNQLQPEDTSYNMPAAARMTGDLDVAALELSLTEIIRRHEVLRTVLSVEDDEPVQVILPAQPVQIPPVDLSHLHADEQEQEFRRLARAEAQRPFTLNRGPLIRFTLLRLDADEHILLLNMHHTVFDGWSIAVFIKELTALYAAHHGGVDSPLAELPVQYADYAVWQREWLRGEVLERQLAYWKKQLAVAPPALNLPTDKPRQAVRTADGESESFRLSPSLVASLKALGREEGATLFMVLLAAFQVLLSRYTSQTDVPVGTVVSNRNRSEVEELIGFFVNMLVMRGDLSGDPTFREYLGQVRETALEAYAHQDVPFEVLVDSLQVERSTNRTPLFQVSFVLQNTPAAALELAGVKLTQIELQTGRAQFDLSLVVTESEDGGAAGSITYDAGLFYPATVRRMVEHFRTLLENAAARPEAVISRLPLLTEAEREDLLFTQNRTDCPYPRHKPLHTLFEEQAARTPLRTALRTDSSQISYAELNRRANRLAHHLRSLGVGPEHLVALCLHRSDEMVVALLAVLKAGAAYLPLDPDYPRERLAFMLEDARPTLVLTERSLRARLPDATPTLCLDTAREAVASEGSENLPCTVTPDGLVYVIYTSGSTGRPKGAMVSHGGVVNCISWMQETYVLDEDDRFLLRTSLNFDPSVWEIFWPLSVGAQVVVAHPDRHSDPEYLSECVKRQEVTCLYFVPSMLKAFLEEATEEGCKSVRYVICGGEALSMETMSECMRVLPAARLHHSYGPTETSIAATEWECDEAAARRRGVVSMGSALGNTRLYVLDGCGQPVPEGVTGELYIGGAGLGRGYLRRPALTAERFVPDPYSGEAGARLYRTGDLVRYAAGGVLEYVGRGDQQVKLRGYRIELGEIEAAVRAHEGVRECVAVVEGEGEGRRLVAYVVAEAASTPTPAQLRTHLKGRLPEYMVPAEFIELEGLPLTANGKLDRKALAAEYAARATPAPGPGGREPAPGLEAEVAEVWCAALGRAAVGAEEDFFAAGGHSLLATRVVSGVRKRFGVEVGLREFFEAATVEGLARLIHLARLSRTESEPPSIVRASRERYRLSTTRQGKAVLPEALRKETVQE